MSETRSFPHCSLSGPLLASHFVSECLRPICALFGTRCAYLSPSLAALGAYLCPLWQALVCISALLGHPLCVFLPSWVAVVPMSAFFSLCLLRRSLCLFLPSLAPFVGSFAFFGALCAYLCLLWRPLHLSLPSLPPFLPISAFFGALRVSSFY